MNKLTWKEIAELVGLATILLGMYFVYAEIQQNGVIARVELSSFAQQRMEYIRAPLMDSEFSKVYIKGVKTPTELDESERQQLNAFFADVVGVMIYERHNYRLGIFEEYESLTRLLARRYLMQGFGRAWWNVEKVSVPPEIVEVVDQELMNLDRSLDWTWSDSRLREQIESLR